VIVADYSTGSSVAIDSSVYTFDGTSLVISTTSNTKIKSYSLRATATITGYSSITNFISFTVIVMDSCDSISVSSIALTTP
jgi:hypothetical protein